MKYKNNTSGYKGVSWNEHLKCFQAYINFGGKRVSLGCYDKDEAIMAALSYDLAAREYHGEDADINNVPNRENYTSWQQVYQRHARERATSHFRGVKKTTSGKYDSRIRIDGVRKYLGKFLTPEEAAFAYNEEAIAHYGLDWPYLNSFETSCPYPPSGRERRSAESSSPVSAGS
jgi:hypothetical protein